MMWIPFRKEIDQTFRSDHSLWKKLAAAAFVSTFIVSTWLVKFTSQHTHGNGRPLQISPFVITAIIAAAPLLGMGLAFTLSLKDVVQRRIECGESVHPLLRIYLGMGVWSLVAWFPTIIAVVFLFIMASFS